MRLLLIAGLLLIAPHATWAERADRTKPTVLEADKSFIDELKQTAVYTGNVLLTKGTLRITGEKMEVRESPEGYRTALVTAAPGQLATYRQRRDPTRDGVDEIVEGFGERIEYDERTETVKFITRAQWRRLENAQPRDEINGSTIVYNARDRSTAIDGAPADGKGGRVRTIIAPQADPAPPAAPLPLKPAAPK